MLKKLSPFKEANVTDFSGTKGRSNTELHLVESTV